MRYDSIRRVGIVIAASLALAACEHAGPLEADVDEATFSAIQATVFNTSCALSGCHAGGGAPLGLDLSEGRAYDNLVEVRSEEVTDLFRVDPGNPDDSYLVIKIEGGERMAEGTARMPLGRSPLGSDQIDRVRSWIADGAPNN